MTLSIYNNLMARSTARTLGNHYPRLATSVQRLSSGLRINSAADDAAGLAIRELMRANIASCRQGIRNANDAISMIQIADGALSVIDEKLIRMKELAEQAATGTYDSTQRLIIDSEFQAMGAEIDRIARATDFNGIKLLDGSLSGTHDGEGLTSTGAMKIHFGPGNDSAEDYYYVEIGDCTLAGLGLAENLDGAPTAGHWEIKTGLHQQQQTFTPQKSYIEYTDPDTGNKYYTDGEYYFSSLDDPVSSVLDWETQGDIIERLKTMPMSTTSSQQYDIYVDPLTGDQYYRYQTNTYDSGFVLSPADPACKPLDASNAAEKAIIDRLQYDNKKMNIICIWDMYLDDNNVIYYTRDGGLTFIKDTNKPYEILYNKQNPDHKDEIAKLEPKIVEKKISTPIITTYIPAYRDPVTNKVAYSHDGKTFYSKSNASPDSIIDPVTQKDVLDRLVIDIDYKAKNIQYYTYYIMDGSNKVNYYTFDGGKTFTKNEKDPLQIDIDAANPAHAGLLAQLQPEAYTWFTATPYYEYVDPFDPTKKYYTSDKGNTFCTDITNPAASKLDKNDPGYSALVARLVETDTLLVETTEYTCYQDVSGIKYWTSDNGQTFVRDYNKPDQIALDKSNPAHAQAIAALTLSPDPFQPTVLYDVYEDPLDNNKLYYTPRVGSGSYFISDVKNYDKKALDSSDPAQKAVMDRLQPVQRMERVNTSKQFPDVYYIYEDGNSGKIYYSYGGDNTITSSWRMPYEKSNILDPSNPADKAILDNLTPVVTTVYGQYKVWVADEGATAATIQTQQAAQHALVTIDRAIVSKDKIRAHLGAMQNRLENTVINISIQAENLLAAESRISDADVATEMTEFVRNQILTQSSVAMLAQANSLPRLLVSLIEG